MLKKAFSLLLASTMLTGMCSSFTVNAAENEKSGHTPNVSTLTLKADNNVSKFYSADGKEVDINGLNTSTYARRRALLPSKYDLRDEGRSTSVKDQGDYGFCWSFASTASMESNILTKKLDNAQTISLIYQNQVVRGSLATAHLTNQILHTATIEMTLSTALRVVPLNLPLKVFHQAMEHIRKS